MGTVTVVADGSHEAASTPAARCASPAPTAKRSG